MSKAIERQPILVDLPPTSGMVGIGDPVVAIDNTTSLWRVALACFGFLLLATLFAAIVVVLIFPLLGAEFVYLTAKLKRLNQISLSINHWN